MGLADLKERSKHPKKDIADRSRLRLRVRQSCVGLFFSSTASPKPRERLQRASERKLEIPDFAGVPIQHRGVKGRQAADGSSSSSGQGQAGREHRMAHEQALALARSGRVTGRPAVIEPGRGSRPARRGTRGGSELPGRTRRCGKPFTGMLPKGKGTPWRRSSFRAAGMSNTPPALPWRFRESLSV